jgi:hypothetical protein
MKTKWQQKEQIQKLIRIINDRLINIQVLKGGLIMTNKTLLIVFKEHPQLKQEWDMLQIRRDKLRRLLWQLP